MKKRGRGRPKKENPVEMKKYQLRIPPAMYDRVAALAKKRHVSVNSLILIVLEEQLKADEQEG